VADQRLLPSWRKWNGAGDSCRGRRERLPVIGDRSRGAREASPVTGDLSRVTRETLPVGGKGWRVKGEGSPVRGELSRRPGGSWPLPGERRRVTGEALLLTGQCWPQTHAVISSSCPNLVFQVLSWRKWTTAHPSALPWNRVLCHQTFSNTGPVSRTSARQFT
jgi:hypothetical protein